MEKIVAVVICGLVALTTAGRPAAATNADGLLRKASNLSGLPVRRVVPQRMLAGPQYDAALLRAADREYPRSLRSIDTALYKRLGLMPRTLQAQLASNGRASRAWYDPLARRLLLRRAPRAQRAWVVNELVRALVDQNFNLRRIAKLRVRDRDRAIAAKSIVDGTAALASGVSANPVRGTPLERFVELDSGLGAGKALAKELRYLGGPRALASALRLFPQTTEQLLHIDKFLQRERALPVRLPTRIGDWRLSASETFGELDVRSLLRAFGVPNAVAVAEGWGGGRIGIYVSPTGQTTAMLALRWDSVDDSAEWRAAVTRYVGAAFPGATARDCPPLDGCWSSTWDVAAGVLGSMSVFASGPASDMLAAALLTQI
ncbi:MAG: hypothetical protein ACXVRA_08575 [Gaiellaceae bacterium]